MSKIKNILEALGHRPTRLFEHFEHKTRSFVEKILQERQVQGKDQSIQH